MYCGRCGQEMEPGAHFCGFCGWNAGDASDLRYCISCGAPLPEGAKFCGACGASIARPEAEGDVAGTSVTELQPVEPSPTEQDEMAPAPAVAAPQVQNPPIGVVADAFAQVYMDKRDLADGKEALAELEKHRQNLLVATVICAVIGPMIMGAIFSTNEPGVLFLFALLSAGLPYGMSCIHGFFSRHGFVIFANWIVMCLLLVVYIWISLIAAIPYAIHLNHQIKELRENVSALQARVDSYKA